MRLKKTGRKVDVVERNGIVLDVRSEVETP